MQLTAIHHYFATRSSQFHPYLLHTIILVGSQEDSYIQNHVAEGADSTQLVCLFTMMNFLAWRQDVLKLLVHVDLARCSGSSVAWDADQVSDAQGRPVHTLDAAAGSSVLTQ